MQNDPKTSTPLLDGQILAAHCEAFTVEPLSTSNPERVSYNVRGWPASGNDSFLDGRSALVGRYRTRHVALLRAHECAKIAGAGKHVGLYLIEDDPHVERFGPYTETVPRTAEKQA